MAQQQFYQPQRRKRDSDYQEDGGWSPGQRASIARSKSGDAQNTLGNIDSVLGGQESAAGRGGISQSEARAAKNRRTGANRPQRETTRRPVGDNLADKENNAGDSLYNGGGDQSAKEKLKKGLLKKWLTKKKAAAAGGISGGLLGIGLFGLTFVSGPMEFIHVAEILHDAHFGPQEDSGDSRVGRIYRFLRKGNSVGETRLNWLESKYHNRIVGKLKTAGLVPEYGTLDTYNGFSIDTESENSPYKDMSPEQAAAKFEETTGIKPDIHEGKVKVNAKTFWSQRKSLKVALKQTGSSKLGTALAMRVMAKFGFVTWHPLKILDKKINTKVADVVKNVKEKWKKRISTGEEKPIAIDASSARNGNPDAVDEHGNPVELKPDEQKAASSVTEPETSKRLLGSLKAKVGLGVAGGAAAIAGLTCALKGVNDNVAKIRYAQVMIPLMRIGMNAVTIGFQLQSGVDVDPRELEQLQKNLHTAKDGLNRSWYDNVQMRRAAGDKSPGIDSLRNNGTRDLVTQNSISWLAWTGSDAIKSLCSDVGQVTTTIISVGIGIVTGGVASTAAGLIAGAALTGPIIDKVSDLLAGEAINSDIGGVAADVFGGEMDTGAALGANAAALSMGGGALTTQEAAIAQANASEENKADFQSKSMFARMFDPYDYRSLTGHLADSMGGGMLSNANSLFNGIIGSFGNVLSLPFNLYSSTAHADSPALYYDYGFPTYGFSDAELNNSLVDDPFANAETVAQMLDKNDTDNTPDWIGKAKDCFGVNITKGPEGWDVIPEKDINIYDKTAYDPAACSGPRVNNAGRVQTAAAHIKIGAADTSAPVVMKQTATTAVPASQAADWFRIRMFIMDTRVMEGLTCAHYEDSTSCANSYGTSSGPATPTTGAPTGPLNTIDQAAMYKDSSNVPCATGTIDLKVHTGYHGGQPVQIHLCGLPDVPSTSEESQKGSKFFIDGAWVGNAKEGHGIAIVNAYVSANFQDLATRAKAAGHPLYANSSFRTMEHQQNLCNDNALCSGGDYTYVAKPGTSNHQMGLAIDFAIESVKGSTDSCVGRARAPGDPMWVWLNNNAKQDGISQYTNESWHWDTLVRKSNCGGDGS